MFQAKEEKEKVPIGRKEFSKLKSMRKKSVKEMKRIKQLLQ